MAGKYVWLQSIQDGVQILWLHLKGIPNCSSLSSSWSCSPKECTVRASAFARMHEMYVQTVHIGLNRQHHAEVEYICSQGALEPTLHEVHQD